MKSEIIQSLTSDFESSSKKTAEGIEFWLARDLQKLLSYDKWSNFSKVIDKAKISCESSGHDVSDHFAEVGKTIEMPKGAEKEVLDIMLTRYACYLVAQNGDPRKVAIAFAQTYFAIQTRKFELIEQRLLESERLSARKKLTETEKELSSLIFEQTGSDKNFGIIRSKGDAALFNHSTQAMKSKWEVPAKRALADFAPTLILKAKDFATEITIHNSKTKDLKKEDEISTEHVINNKSVRKTLLERGIVPEKLNPEEDSKKLERRLIRESKKGLKSPEKLS